MPNAFFTADTHFGHAGIVLHYNRPFISKEEMDEAMITRWNEVVRKGDHVYHLGDFAWKNHSAYRSRLNGEVHLILGNHDKMAGAAKKLFSSVRDVYCGRICTREKRAPKFFLSHYPHVSWNGKAGHNGTIHLYGHVHGSYSRAGELSMDVGVDTHNFYPYALEEVVSLVDAKISAKSSSQPSTQTNT